MKLAKHMRLSREGVYHFRLAVPKWAKLSQIEICHSLHTREPATARNLAYAFTTYYQAKFRGIDLDIKKAIESFTRGKDFELEFHPNGRISKVKTDGTAQDNKDANEAIKIANIGYVGDFKPAETETEGTTVKEALRLYLNERDRLKDLKTTSINPNTEAERISQLHKFTNWFDEYILRVENKKYFPVSKLTKKHMKAYDFHLRSQELSLSSRGKYGGFITVFLKWCQGEGLFPSQFAIPTEDIFVNGKSEKETRTKTRVEYSIEELNLMFKSGALTIEKPDQYFLPLLAVFTGARINELASLSVNDVSIFKDIFVLFIDGTKTKTSVRTIPIHPKIIEIGFLEYIQDIKELGYDKLFPYLNRSRNNNGDLTSDWFRKELIKLGLKPKKDDSILKDFHAFRHTFNVSLIDNDVSPEKREDLLGHKNSTINKGTYGKLYSAVILKESLDQVDYENIDLSAYRYSKHMFKSSIVMAVRRNENSSKAQQLRQNKKKLQTKIT